MSTLSWIAALGLAWLAATGLHRRRSKRQRRSAQPLRRRPRRAHRLGDRRRRRAAAVHARELATRLAANDPRPGAHLAAGVVAQPGEVAWLRAPAQLSVWVSEPAWVTSTRRSWLDRRAESIGRWRASEGWQEEGRVDWLVTSARLVGRVPRSGELLSIPWASVVGLEVDLFAGVVRVQTANGWRCGLTGPGVAPIAVAGVAACHGVAALADHPGLARLRDRWRSTDPVRARRPDPLALPPGG